MNADRAQRGMPGFRTTLKPGESEAIHAYIIKRANDEKAVMTERAEAR